MMRGKGKGERGKFGLYVHSPFCKSKCIYCDFNSYAGCESLIGDYIDALILEIERADAASNPPAESIYFGGGNPALLGVDGLARVMIALKTKFNISDNTEITIESNPEDATTDALSAWRRTGFNRLSIGFQSFDDEDLRLLGRRHDAAEAVAAFNSARGAGFESINFDLIFGLPGRTTADWLAGLEAAAKLSPDHISAYGLTVEPGTALERLVETRKITLPGEDEQAEMMEMTHAYLTGDNGHGMPCPYADSRQPDFPFPLPLHASETEAPDNPHLPSTLYALPFIHYELSNYARPGHECRHNLNYWRGGDYLGFGAGAHSHRSGRRWWNKAKPADYIDIIREGSGAAEGEEILSASQRAAEAVFLGLRLAEGLPVIETDKRFGCDLKTTYAAEIAELKRQNLLITGDRWRLTPSGMLLANEVMSRFV